MAKCIVCKKDLEHINANMCEDCYDQAIKDFYEKTHMRMTEMDADLSNLIGRRIRLLRHDRLY